jgi:hypothetical protein
LMRSRNNANGVNNRIESAIISAVTNVMWVEYPSKNHDHLLIS